jgi:hypothetical protein
LQVLASSRNRIFSFIWIGILAASFFLVFLADTISIIYGNYTNFEDAASQSDGAFVRLAMNIVPSLLFLLFHKRFSIPEADKRLWKWFSYNFNMFNDTFFCYSCLSCYRQSCSIYDSFANGRFFLFT